MVVVMEHIFDNF